MTNRRSSADSTPRSPRSAFAARVPLARDCSRAGDARVRGRDARGGRRSHAADLEWVFSRDPGPDDAALPVFYRHHRRLRPGRADRPTCFWATGGGRLLRRRRTPPQSPTTPNVVRPSSAEALDGAEIARKKLTRLRRPPTPPRFPEMDERARRGSRRVSKCFARARVESSRDERAAGSRSPRRSRRRWLRWNRATPRFGVATRRVEDVQRVRAPGGDRALRRVGTRLRKDARAVPSSPVFSVSVRRARRTRRSARTRGSRGCPPRDDLPTSSERRCRGPVAEATVAARAKDGGGRRAGRAAGRERAGGARRPDGVVTTRRDGAEDEIRKK